MADAGAGGVRKPGYQPSAARLRPRRRPVGQGWALLSLEGAAALVCRGSNLLGAESLGWRGPLRGPGSAIGLLVPPVHHRPAHPGDADLPAQIFGDLPIGRVGRRGGGDLRCRVARLRLFAALHQSPDHLGPALRLLLRALALREGRVEAERLRGRGGVRRSGDGL